MMILVTRGIQKWGPLVISKFAEIFGEFLRMFWYMGKWIYAISNTTKNDVKEDETWLLGILENRTDTFKWY